MSYNYAQLSMGSKEKKSNAQVQALLNEKDNAGLEVDGIFGPKTNQAVINYQKKNGLQPDGIVGPKTWESLLSTTQKTTAAAKPQNTGAAVDVGDLRAEAEAAKQQYEKQNAFLDTQALYDQAARDYLNRDPFSYDLHADPVYQQYLEQYTTAGRHAMEDTMGRAAALTGGYGNSYAQTAGQQAYGSYLQQLNEQVPALYELAYSKYQQEGQDLRDRYNLLKERRDDEYTRQQDALDRSEKARKEQYAQQQDALDRQQTQLQRMMDFIAQGYIPTDEELAKVGMTRRQAYALATSNG